MHAPARIIAVDRGQVKGYAFAAQAVSADLTKNAAERYLMNIGQGNFSALAYKNEYHRGQKYRFQIETITLQAGAGQQPRIHPAEIMLS